MRRTIMVIAGMLVFALPLGAQQGMDHSKMGADPDHKVTGGGTLPAGWSMRMDRANSKAEDVKFVPMGKAFHVTLGPAAVFYNPKITATGKFEAQAKFTQTKAPMHPEAYGLFIGGKNLDKENQEYLYFIVRQDGKYMIKHRAGAQVHTVAEWTDNAAVNKADAAGKATNELEIEIAGDAVEFEVNGKQVHSIPATQFSTDGIVGLRVNHNLDVHIEDFKVNGKAVAVSEHDAAPHGHAAPAKAKAKS
jgi:hypothetical protein